MWARIIVVCVAVTILLTPIFILYLLEMSGIAAATMILIFVLVFAILISIFTRGKVETVFIGTAT